MSKSSYPEPPILAEAERAKNCFGLNATVLPGLGTFRSGSRFRGFIEMAVAVGGTLLFCRELFSVFGDWSEEVKLWQAILPHVPMLGLGFVLILGSWLSGIFYAKSLFRR